MVMLHPRPCFFEWAALLGVATGLESQVAFIGPRVDSCIHRSLGTTKRFVRRASAKEYSD